MENGEIITINDFILLGRAVPEERKDGRRTICAAGYSRTHGFIRLYPTRPDMKWSRWDVCRVKVQRNPKDSRVESWRLAEPNWAKINDSIKVIGTLPESERWPLISSLVTGCVQDLNKARVSLGIVFPQSKSLSGEWVENKLRDKPYQMSMGAAFTYTEYVDLKRDYYLEPRIMYRCSDCKVKTKHKMQILEWGFYRWQSRYDGEDKAAFIEHSDKVWENAHLYQPDYDTFLFVGNQQNQRTSFMVISVLSLNRPQAHMPNLF